MTECKTIELIYLFDQSSRQLVCVPDYAWIIYLSIYVKIHETVYLSDKYRIFPELPTYQILLGNSLSI